MCWLTRESPQTEQIASHLQLLLSNYRANVCQPSYAQDLSSTGIGKENQGYDWVSYRLYGEYLHGK